MRYLAVIIVGLLLAASVAATGVLITAQSMEAGLNDAAFYRYQAGDSASAERLYRAAIAENPGYELARYNLATLLFGQGRFEEAAAELEALIAIDPAKAAYRYDLAVNLIENIRQNGRGLEQFDRAVAEYEQADRLEPGFSHVRENLEVLYRIRASAASS